MLERHATHPQPPVACVIRIPAKSGVGATTGYQFYQYAYYRPYGKDTNPIEQVQIDILHTGHGAYVQGACLRDTTRPGEQNRVTIS